MNLQKALRLTIGLFVLANLLLGVANYRKYIEVYQLSPTRQTYIENILAEKNIALVAKLPRYFFPMGSLSLEPFELTATLRDSLVEQILGKDQPITITKTKANKVYGKAGRIYTKDKESLSFYDNYVVYENKGIEPQPSVISEQEALKIAKQFMNAFKIEEKFKNTKISYKVESYGATLTYYEVYKGLPIFDSHVKISMTGDKVFSATFQGVSQIKEKTVKKEIYPIDLVLFGISDRLSEIENVTITDITLGFGMQNKEGVYFVKEEALPMYKIEATGLNTPLFVNAYTNMVEDDIDFIVLLEK